ncbi:MAG: IclR family transcriptional regulator [Gammaproteobacteria bacterium]|nr:IclR family transcriptional regulator [Gammaproteobacteria bacterium]MBU1440469.1 IclR family transcriptional regulator [Gammaproteobacteria bacterium]MBU2287300.1 IclR family transcriptional regulator [Gammaproteobacteria bacterium]MBU2407878.1 IclR family transcriptional regulator [Gammaproteobacteria bacterium]
MFTDDKPGRSPANRSLERGIEILRAFRPGSELLGNAEIAERTGLSRSTVSRLTQTLVGSGYLQLDLQSRALRLAPAVLSLSHAMRAGSSLLAIAAPLMRATAEAHRINVGLAAADREEMVYLESIRYNRRPSMRTVVSGQRVPMELTSLGRAYLAGATEAVRKRLIARFRQVRRAQWAKMGPTLAQAVRDVETQGYCAASWQAEVVAVATPFVFQQRCYALNASVTTAEPFDTAVAELAPALMALKTRIERALVLAQP